MRWTLLLMVLVAAPAAARADERNTEVTMATPATVQLTNWCGFDDKGCGQAAADVAQERCAKFKRDAQLADSRVVQREMLPAREKRSYRFNCVK